MVSLLDVGDSRHCELLAEGEPCVPPVEDSQ